MTIMAPSLDRYATEHKIQPVPTPDGWQVCGHCGVRIYRVLSQRFQHDPNQLRKLRSAAAREDLDRGVVTFPSPEALRVARVIHEASAPLREFVVVEANEGYVVTADLADDAPAHDHFDIWDGTETCPRCAFDMARAEG